MITNPLLYRFLGLKRISELFSALNRESKRPKRGSLSSFPVILAILVSLLPFYSSFLTLYAKRLDITTVFVGIATCLAIVLRNRIGITLKKTTRWKVPFSLTHTAFAIGAIPTVIMLIIAPHSFSHISTNQNIQPVFEVERIPIISVALFILGVSVWAGVTEEIIYRNMLISIIRRWKAIKRPITRNVLAVFVSSAIFALTHLPTWGISLSVAHFGLGVGFGLAYIATGELILPIIFYHIAFDILSLTFSYLSYRF
ncbi:MAG: CPBP family intramembrane metalloprotease [Candidatus Dadabacteria bacterium]|nr:MAG: CPBP family intramembrane metalloprotease [Candidatus Dadabacteria bacterium]